MPKNERTKHNTVQQEGGETPPDIAETPSAASVSVPPDIAEYDSAPASSANPGNSTSTVQAELYAGGRVLIIRGRTLRLVLWLARHQAHINESTAEHGQLWLTWKGDAAIDGSVRFPL